MFRRRKAPPPIPEPKGLVPIGEWAWAYNEIRDKLLPTVEAELIEGTNEERVLLGFPYVVRLRACAAEIEEAVVRELDARGHGPYVERIRRTIGEDVAGFGRSIRDD
jgi:hypothetical protein